MVKLYTPGLKERPQIISGRRKERKKERKKEKMKVTTMKDDNNTKIIRL